MKIAIFGYYHALNAGDDRIQYCINRLLNGHNVVFLPHYLPPPVEYLKTFDWILIGGGGLVFEHVGIWRDISSWLRSCKANIGVLGLGVNRVTRELEPELNALIERSDFFYVRDRESKVLLNDHSKVQVFPDVTWCYPISGDQSQDQGIALNLLPCHWKEWDPDAWVNALGEHQIHPFPFHFGKGRDADLLSKYYGNSVPKEFTLTPLLKCQILVACRFHAIIFAMQIRKPFLAINYDEKIHRLLKESDLLDCCLETTEFERVRSAIEMVLSQHDYLVDKIDDFAVTQEQDAAELKENIFRHIGNTDLVEQTATPLASFKRIAKQFLKTNQ